MSRECYNFTFRRGIIGHRDAERNFMGNGGEGGGERSGLRTSHYNSSHVDRSINCEPVLFNRTTRGDDAPQEREDSTCVLAHIGRGRGRRVK